MFSLHEKSKCLIDKVKNDLLALCHYNMFTNDDAIWSSVAFIYLNLLLNRPLNYYRSMMSMLVVIPHILKSP